MVSRLLENMSRCRSEWPAGHAVRRSAGLARLAHSLCGQVGTVGALAGTLHSTVSLVRKGSRRWRDGDGLLELLKPLSSGKDARRSYPDGGS